MSNSKRVYTNDYKRETVALITQQGYSINDAAQAVQTSDKNIRRWLDDPRFNQQITSGLNQDEKAELMQLRKENKQLRMEKEILKKASTFFAREMK